MASALHITLVAGGTGGHMMPAEAVSKLLVARGHHVDLITDRRGDAYKNIMPDLPRTVLKTGHMSSVGPIGKMQLAGNLFKSYRACKAMMRVRRPNAVVGFGGYPSLPATRAASSLGIATLLHEQNAVLGRSNRALAAKCDAIALSFERTQRLPDKYVGKSVYTGNPVRADICDIGAEPYLLPATGAPFTILIIGGSQGARVLSAIVPKAIANLPQDTLTNLAVYHQARQEDLDAVSSLYAAAGVKASVVPFFSDMTAQLQRAHLVISRAGASSVSEIAAAARPAIYCPLPSATDDHQTANARSITAGGGGWLLAEQQFSAVEVSRLLQEIMANKKQLLACSQRARATAKIEATEQLADLITNVATRNSVS